jgi:glycosyltransferase involved in cell wall biosynthesis
MAMIAHDVVVLLGSRWAALEDVTTRWQQVIRRWSARPDVARLTVVDFPRFRPGVASVTASPSWLPTVPALALTVPLSRRRPLPVDTWGWRWSARVIERALRGPRAPRVFIATTPLWSPMLPYVSVRAGFDAYDDWRELPAVAQVRHHVAAGYRAAARLPRGSVTVANAALSVRLKDDFGIDGLVVPNGADAAAIRAGGQAPAGLPSSPFAVYVGVIQDRVDVDLLCRSQRVVATVVAGAVDEATRDRLDRAGVTCLGHVSPSLVPGLLQRAAVGLVPHVVNDLTASMDPMKIYDYRAAGLPVVTTPVAGTREPGVIVAAPDSWEPALRDALTVGRTPSYDVRDWDQVAEELFHAHVGSGHRLHVGGRAR